MVFVEYIIYILSGTKKSIQVGLNAFFEEMKEQYQDYTKQAFSKGRKRIKPEAFLWLFQNTVKTFYQGTKGETWHGFHLLAIDGTKLNLPNTSQLRELYGEQKSSGAPQVQALVSCLYDVLNKLLLDVVIGPCKDSERDHAREMIQRLDRQLMDRPLFLMDRGYPSAQLLELLAQQNYFYSMRCCSEFIRSLPLTSRDQIIEHRFQKVKKTMKLRALTIRLPDGSDEVLISNVFDSSLSLQDFMELYHKRWGIETKYDDIKNKLQIENFSGDSSIAVLQDFYASLFLSNLAAVLQFDMHDEIHSIYNTPEKKYLYQLNVNLTISQLKSHVLILLSTDSPFLQNHTLSLIQKRLLKAVVPIRPGRSFPRIRRHKSSKFPLNSKLP